MKGWKARDVAMVIAIATVFASCGGPTDVDRTLVPGLVAGFQAGDPDVAVTIAEGEVSIRVSTYGNGCREKGDVRVTVSNDDKTVRIAPFDWLVHAEACDDVLRTFQHTTTLELAADTAWVFTANRDQTTKQLAS